MSHEPVDEETLTRNLDELLQELRVMQTGVQILTGFLLTVPFTDKFADLDSVQRSTFLTVLCGSVLTTAVTPKPCTRWSRTACAPGSTSRIAPGSCVPDGTAATGGGARGNTGVW